MTDGARSRGSLGSAIVLVWAGGAAVFAVGLAVRFLFRIPLATLTRDPVAVFDGPFYAGAISNIGVLAWAAAATVCLFGSAFLRGRADLADARRFLLYFCLVTVLLLVDDLFLLHEDVLYGYLGVPELLTFGVYGAFGLIGLVVFRRVIARTDVLLLVMALALFAFSVASDLFPGTPARHLVEDGSKLVGIFAWLAYFARAATAFVREAAAPQAR